MRPKLTSINSLFSSFLPSSNAVYKNTVNSENNLKEKEGMAFIHLITNWEQLAGIELSRHSIPLKLQNGVLQIMTDHSAYSQKISFMQNDLIEKICKKYPFFADKIQKLSFNVNETFFKKIKDKKTENLKSLKKQKTGHPEQKENEFLLHPLSPEYLRLKKLSDDLFCDIKDQEIKESMQKIFFQLLK